MQMQRTNARILPAAPRHGFTLVELLVVIAIISILAALLLPALEEALNSARKLRCLNNLRQNGTVLQTYTNDFDGWMPQNSWSYYMPNRTGNADWIEDYYEAESIRAGENDLMTCPGAKLRDGVNTHYRPGWYSGGELIAAYYFNVGRASYTQALPDRYWYGWKMGNNSSTESYPKAPYPRVQFADRHVTCPESGARNYVASPSITALAVDLNEPITGAPGNGWYYNNHPDGENAAYQDGHGAFLRNENLQKRCVMYW